MDVGKAHSIRAEALLLLIKSFRPFVTSYRLQIIDSISRNIYLCLSKIAGIVITCADLYKYIT